tara:strand:+ start:85 stop:1191 length:1107 start_codon:yes stop_codon:yes gene_type:complete
MGIFDFFKKSKPNKCKECGDIIQSEFEICFDCKNKLKENENGFNNIPTPDGGRVEFNKVNGEVDGYMNVYYPSGEKLSEAFYKNNQPLSFKKFHLNGNISEIANMKNAEITGLLKKYYESGKLAEESYWEKGKQNGEYKYYYENSSIERQGMMRNGEQHGYWKFYYESGKLSEESYWEKGKQNGEYKLYDENGNLNEEGNSKNLKIEADVNNGEKVIDNMLLKFQKNIKEVKPEFDAVTSRREIIKSYYLKGLEIDNMIEHFGVIIRSETLDAYRKEELTIDDICSSIEGFYLICEELRKIIETKQKLFNNGEISESSDALIYNYWSSHSLHLGYVQTLTLLRKEDPKFDVMKWGKYFNEHTFYYNPK